MSEKNKRAEELLFGKERMTFTEIMQSMEACAKINCEKCALHAIIDGWSQADLPDCSTVLMKNASDTLLEYYNKLRTPEPAVNAKAEERHELRSLNRRTDKIMREVEGVFTPNELREAFGKEPMQENIKYLDADR